MFGRSREDARLKEGEWMSQGLIQNPMQVEPVLGDSSSNPEVTQTPPGTTRNGWGLGGEWRLLLCLALQKAEGQSGREWAGSAAEGADLQ